MVIIQEVQELQRGICLPDMEGVCPKWKREARIDDVMRELLLNDVNQRSVYEGQMC